jgi:hypothetical protein
MSGDLLLTTGTVSIGDSGALGIGCGLSASGLVGSIAISVGSGTNIGEAFCVMAGTLSGAAGGDASVVYEILSNQQRQDLDSALG